MKLVTLFSSHLSECSMTIDSTTFVFSTSADAEVEDIIGMLDFLDNKGVLQEVSFAATNTDRLPKLDPEGLNDCAVADKQGQLETQVSQLARQVETLTNKETLTRLLSVNRLNEQLNELHTAVQTQFSTLTAAHTRWQNSRKWHREHQLQRHLMRDPPVAGV
jgi:hypothetical protein